jgi:hypothetical protein
VGLVLTGSRGHGAFVRPETDWDLRLIVKDEALDRAAARHSTPHGSPIEVFVMRLTTFEGAGAIGSSSEWDRYSFVRVPALIDKLDGRIADLIAAKSLLTTQEIGVAAPRDLDGYVNSYYRALKNARAGLSIEAHLDAAESISPLLGALFAMHGRVRPFNRYLRWELKTAPLPEAWLAADDLLPRLAGIVATGTVTEQAALFRDVEGLARSAGYGDVVDSWEPDVSWLRSGERPPIE